MSIKLFTRTTEQTLPFFCFTGHSYTPQSTGGQLDCELLRVPLICFHAIT